MAFTQQVRSGLHLLLIIGPTCLFGISPMLIAQSPTVPAIVIPVRPEWPTTDLSSQIIDDGYAGYHQMIDVNGDGNPDFCRFVGDAPDGIFLSCQLGTAPKYLSKNPYGLNSPKGLPMGSPPWAILSGSQNEGPRYCANFEGPVKEMPGVVAPLSTYRLKCILGTPPIKGQTQRFLTAAANPCAAGETGKLLTEDDARRDPYLFCSNALTGGWSAQRQDPDGISWIMTGVTMYSKIDGSTTTTTLLRQMTYRLQPGGEVLPAPKTKGYFPTRYGSSFTVKKDGSTTRDEYTAGLDNSANFLAAYNDVGTNITRKEIGFTLSILKETCSSTSKLCTTVGTFGGTSSDGLTIQWSDNKAPSAADMRPSNAALTTKFSKVAAAQAETTRQMIAKSDPALAAIPPAKWTSDDISKMITILTAETTPPRHPATHCRNDPSRAIDLVGRNAQLARNITCYRHNGDCAGIRTGCWAL